MGWSYKKAGVDISTGDRVVRDIARLASSTYGKSVIAGIGGFGGAYQLGNSLRNPVLVSGADGVGTKVKIAIALGKHDTVGIDLVAMNVDDVICSGARPLFFLDYIGCHKISPTVMKQLLSGMVEGCRMAGCTLLGGETAEMPDMYARGEYDLAGFAVGVVERGKMIRKESVRGGDLVIGLGSSGLHSNGFTLARKVLPKKLFREMLTPTRIYAPFILKALIQFDIHGIAHITGGGIPGNTSRVIPKGLGVEIYEGSWPIPKIFWEIEKRGKISRAEMFKTFNMGIGMVLVIPGESLPAFLAFASKHKQEAYWIGQVKKKIRGVKII